MLPLEAPPFYAVELVAGLVCTAGGGKRDERGCVLDHAGNPIPRLYEAGELGSFHANLYQKGSFLTEAMLSGRWAGANAARERAWTLEAAWQA
jgi:predicted oxidoreductase